jgi:alpha-1,4-N-acetylglucosaminyltransferase EXTL2
MGIPVLRFSLVVILVLLLVAGALTNLLPNAKEDKMLALRRESKSQGKTSLDSFTLIMQTYNRTDLLLRLLNHYQAVPQLHKVIVVWNNVGEKGPDELWNSLRPHPVPLIFKPQTANRMRNCLQVFPELETSAVLMVDEDTLISAQDLVFVFSVWHQFLDHIVGIVPTKHVSTSSGIYNYGRFELQTLGFGNDQYSMVLIPASFFKSKHFELFQRQPTAVHTLIDETQNCDDCAMNFIINKHTGKDSGIFVIPLNVISLEKENNSYSAMCGTEPITFYRDLFV